jgi:hypothetical protein
MTIRESRLVYFCPYCRRIFRYETAVCPNCHGATITQNADFCPACRQTLPDGASTCPHCKRAVIDSLISTDQTLQYAPASNPTRLWYLVAFLFGLIGALIGYVAVRERSDTMATRLLLIGIVTTAIGIYLLYPYLWL